MSDSPIFSNGKEGTVLLFDYSSPSKEDTSSIGTSYKSKTFNFIQQKSPTSVSSEMNAGFYQFSWGSNPDCMKLKPPADATNFKRKFIERA